MITLKLNNYTDADVISLASVIRQSISDLQADIYCNGQCDICIAKNVCCDLCSTLKYLENCRNIDYGALEPHIRMAKREK